jgi:hypothetical protein
LNQESKITPPKNEEDHSSSNPGRKRSRKKLEEDFFAKPWKKITPPESSDAQKVPFIRSEEDR